jgi:hypothetical protein
MEGCKTPGRTLGVLWSLIRYEGPERQRLEICLRRLLPHLRFGEHALTGGVAIEIHRARFGLPSFRTKVADLDFA